MPRWVVDCPACEKTFTHSHISEPEAWSDPFVSPPKPHIPESGVHLNCPNCNKVFAYYQDQLFYRGELGPSLVPSPETLEFLQTAPGRDSENDPVRKTRAAQMSHSSSSVNDWKRPRNTLPVSITKLKTESAIK